MTVETYTSELHRAAIEYVRHGWYVFPLRPGEKLPLLRDRDSEGRGGFYIATTDEAQITEWWRSYPTANIGIRPGPNWLVVDVDRRNGGRMPKWMPETLCALTPGGEHYYLSAPDAADIKSRPIAEGVDVKAWRGYVAAPPSVRDSGGYRWESSFLPSSILPLPEFASRETDPFRGSVSGEHGGVRGGFEPVEPGGPKVPVGSQHYHLVSAAGFFANLYDEEGSTDLLGDVLDELLRYQQVALTVPGPEDNVRKIAEWVVDRHERRR